MKLSFNGISAEEFEALFPDDKSCLAYLADKKWEDGFVCKKCGNDNYCRGKRPSSRRCTRCKTDESATAHTPFHRCRIPVREAFRIAWLCCNSPAISSATISKQLEIRQMTCWKFKKKLMSCFEVTDIA